MHSAIKHMQITTKVDQISEGNASMQRTQVLTKMSSRAQRPAARKGIEHILEANHSCPLAFLAEGLQMEGVLPSPQDSADIWLFKIRGGGKGLWFSHLLSWNGEREQYIK